MRNESILMVLSVNTYQALRRHCGVWILVFPYYRASQWRKCSPLLSLRCTKPHCTSVRPGMSLYRPSWKACRQPGGYTLSDRQSFIQQEGTTCDEGTRSSIGLEFGTHFGWHCLSEKFECVAHKRNCYAYSEILVARLEYCTNVLMSVFSVHLIFILFGGRKFKFGS